METNNGSFVCHTDENQLSFSPTSNINSHNNNFINCLNSTPDTNHYQNEDHHEDVTIPELLPLCDLLFNIISLAAYFCDVVFDSVTVYTLYLQGNKTWFMVTLSLVLFSSIINQILSYRWYIQRLAKSEPQQNCSKPKNLIILFTHFIQCGILWRYFKLFIPVDLSSVKHEVRDLCMLRMVHSFCEAAPMLFIQVYLLLLKLSFNDITDLNIISTCLSTFNLCWALASFSKNVRKKNMHKLVLTWLGVIFQFFWRLGTILSRILTLVIYATVYHQWVFIVIFLHWFSMLIWILFSKKLFNGNKNYLHRIFESSIIAWVYIFCYINLNEAHSRYKLSSFYLIMFLENMLLLYLSYEGIYIYWFKNIGVIIIITGFIVGSIFMILYYRYFHIRHLKHSFLSYNYDNDIECPEHGQFSNGILNGRAYKNVKTGLTNASNNCMMAGIPGVFNCRLNPALKRKKKKPTSFVPPPAGGPLTSKMSIHCGTKCEISPGIEFQTLSSNSQENKHINSAFNLQCIHHSNHGISSVVFQGDNTTNFQSSSHANLVSNISSNCQSNLVSNIQSNYQSKQTNAQNFQGNMSQNVQSNIALISNSNVNSSCNIDSNIIRSPVKMAPCPMNLYTTNLNIPNVSQDNAEVNNPIGSSEHDSSACSRVNISQKLQEKKQQQLAQLREIEEEIKQGKLKPHSVYSPQMRGSYIPCTKKKPWERANSRGTKGVLPYYYYYHPAYRRMKMRSQTPEVLLVPHYLDKSRIYYDMPSCVVSTFGRIANGESMDDDDNERNENVDVINRSILRLKENRSDNNRIKINRLESDNRKIINRNDIIREINNIEPKVCNLQVQKTTSDIESQVSLPRSYTLPREFRYYKTGKRNGRSEGFDLRSNNSSDGDVDSDLNTVDETEDEMPRRGIMPRNRVYRHHNRFQR